MAGNSAGCDRRRHRVVGDATRSLTSRSLTNKRPSEIRPSFMLPLTGSAFLGVNRSWSRPWGRTVRGLTWGNRMGQISAPPIIPSSFGPLLSLTPERITFFYIRGKEWIIERNTFRLIRPVRLHRCHISPPLRDFLNGWGFVEPQVGEAHGPCLGISSFLVSAV